MSNIYRTLSTVLDQVNSVRMTLGLNTLKSLPQDFTSEKQAPGPRSKTCPLARSFPDVDGVAGAYFSTTNPELAIVVSELSNSRVTREQRHNGTFYNTSLPKEWNQAITHFDTVLLGEQA